MSKDASLEFNRGDVLGTPIETAKKKSALLKMALRITEPTELNATFEIKPRFNGENERYCNSS